jgi:glutamine amidotransferase
MGWNDVQASDDEGLFSGVRPLVAYYANSYVCEPEDPSVVTAWSAYGGERIAAAVRRGSVQGVQFHPEKSSTAGRRLLRNFLREAAPSSTAVPLGVTR